MSNTTNIVEIMPENVSDEMAKAIAHGQLCQYTMRLEGEIERLKTTIQHAEEGLYQRMEDLSAEREKVKKVEKILGKIDHEVKDNTLPSMDDADDLVNQVGVNFRREHRDVIREANRICDEVANIIDAALTDTEAK